MWSVEYVLDTLMSEIYKQISGKNSMNKEITNGTHAI